VLEKRTCEVGRLHADKIAFYTVAQPDRSLKRHILLQEMLLHTLERLHEIFLCERFPAHDVPEETPYCAYTRAHDAAWCRQCLLVLLRVLSRYDGVHLLVEVFQYELALVGLAPPRVLSDLLQRLVLRRSLAQVRLRVVEHRVILLFRAKFAPCSILLGAALAFPPARRLVSRRYWPRSQRRDLLLIAP
jgi:hypothetical protein